MDPEEQSVGGTDNIDPNADAVGRDLAAVESEANGEQQEVVAPLSEDAIVDKLTKRWNDEIVPQLRPKPEAKQYTQEELDTHFNVYKPDVDLIKALRGVDLDEAQTTAVMEQLVKMRDGLQKQFATVMEYTLAAKLAEIDGKYAPVAAASAKQVVALVMNNIQAEIRNGARQGYRTPAEAAKAVAEETRSVLKEMGVSTGGNPAGNPQRRMAPLMKGSAPGSSGTRGNSAPSAVSQQLRELA
jgi:hypothetical protein